MRTLSTFKLTLWTLLAMARKRILEPLLIILAIAVANAGLVTVLLINEGASQGELLNQNPKLLSGTMVMGASPSTPLTKADYAKARRAGFTQLTAIAKRATQLRCSNTVNKSFKLDIVGIDTQALINHTSVKSSFSSDIASLTSNQQHQVEDPHALSTIYALMHPATLGKLSCKSLMVSSDKEWPSSIIPVASSAVPQATMVISLNHFYTHDITLIHTPLYGFLSLSAFSQQDTERLSSLLPVGVVTMRNSTSQDTGTLPDSFKLNLWAMSALMGVVALFIVLNALNLMYRTRLPNMIRLRQLGVASKLLAMALFTELFLYCLFGIPIGIVVGFNAAGSLSPVISSTFSSLFDALFITPDINLLSVFLFALSISFTSLLLFAILPVTQLAGALKHQKTTPHQPYAPLLVSALTAVVVFVLYLLTFAITATLHALLYVAALLLSSCVIVLLWLPILSRWLTLFVPKRWAVFYFVVANMHSLSSKTRLAVCAFFIALTANIGMNTMTSSFRDATEQWLTQRLYAPVYLYTDKQYSNLALPASVDATPLLRANATLNGDTVSLTSFPTHQQGAAALLVDKQQPNAWQLFTEGHGVYINQQLAFSQDIEIGDTLALSDIAFINNNKNLRSNDIADERSVKLESVLLKQWEVLGVYPDYGNVQDQVLIPLPYFVNNASDVIDRLFAGVIALSPNGNNTSPLLLNDKDIINAVGMLGKAYSKEEILSQSMKMFDRTFVLTDGLNITTLLVAGIAFAVSLTVLALGNSPQLNTLRALGVSRLRVKGALFVQYFLLCFVTALLAIPFGVYLAYVFVIMVNRYAFNWVYDLTIHADVIALSVATSLLIVSLVLLLPLGKLKPKVDLRQEIQL